MTSKERSPRGAREHIAQLAARLMAQDHIDDFAMAKRKAIRQLGLPEGKNLPTNGEIELALRQYRELYQPEHGHVLTELRRIALQVMERFGEFKPYLTGSVLSGRAGAHSDINLVIYTDNAKAIEVFCLNKGIDYKLEGGAEAAYATLAFEVDGSTVRLSVRPRNDERLWVRGTTEAHERARADQVEALIAG
ncbi:MAG: UDP-N-acetylmuramate--alanine ligase [Burkholderiales bacterium]|nr:UDP-N-acetylmuramate--alanine ligase [Burkholderiales bacterium]